MRDFYKEIKDEDFKSLTFGIFNRIDDDSFPLYLRNQYKEVYSIDDFEYLKFELDDKEKKSLKKNDSIQDQIDDIILELIKERKKQNLSQTKLSQMTGIPQATISRLESFATVPTLYIVIKLSNALNLTLSLG